MSNVFKAQLSGLDGQIKDAELLALYWMAMTTTGVATQRTIRKGGSDGPLMCDKELTAEAMETALRHINRHRELCEQRTALLHAFAAHPAQWS